MSVAATEMAKEGARHLVSNIGGVLTRDEVLNSTEACVSSPSGSSLCFSEKGVL